jgi:predicted aspartyl protease
MTHLLTRWSLVAAAAAIIPSLALAEAELRTWKNTDGRVLNARLVGKTPTVAKFKQADGKLVDIPIRLLVKEDQDIINRWTEQKQKIRDELNSLTIGQILEARHYQSFEYDIDGNHLLVDGEINGEKVRFLIDTGASTSLLDLDTAKSSKCEVGPMNQQVFGIGPDPVPAAASKVKSIVIGDARIENRIVLTVELFKGFGDGYRGNHGAIFGADFMRELEAVIDYPANRIYLKPNNQADWQKVGDEKKGLSLPTGKPPDPNLRTWTNREGRTLQAVIIGKTPEKARLRQADGKLLELSLAALSDADQEFVKKWSVEAYRLNTEFASMTIGEILDARDFQSFKYTIEQNHIIVDGEMNGQKKRYLVDTGAQTTLIDLASAKAAGCEVGPLDFFVVGIGGQKVPAGLAKVKSFKLGDVWLENREVTTADMFKYRPHTKNHDALFGGDFLRELDGVIDYRTSRFWLKPKNTADWERVGEAAADSKPPRPRPGETIADEPKPAGKAAPIK